jgi:TonB family protein
MPTRLLAFLLLLTCLATLTAAQEPTPEPAPDRVRVPNSEMRSLLLRKVQPVYPPLARQARIQGTVVMNVSINKSGDVEEVQLFSGHPILAPAAIAAVKQWKYQPYLINAEPVDIQTVIQVNFTLSDKPPVAPGETPGSATAPQDSSNAQSGGIVGTADAADLNAPLLAIPQRVRVSAGVATGLILTRVAPDYPPDARDQRIEGVVILHVIIDKEGNVSKVDLVSGHPLLAPSAIDAVKQRKYRPYLLNGMPVAVDTTVQVNFTLSGG